MRRSLVRAAALLTTGLVLGLAAGAWIWKGEAGQARSERELVAARRPSPPVLGGQADRAAAEASAAVTVPGRGDRVAELAAKFRAAKDSRESPEEVFSMHFDGIVGLAGLTSGDFARLMGLLAETKLDPEVAMAPLIRWAAVDPQAALAFALSRNEFKNTERIISLIVYEMAKADLSAAKTALGLLEKEERRYSQRAIVRLMQQSDPTAALVYARELSDIEAENNVFKAWAKSDPVAAAAALGPGGNNYGPATESVAGHLMKRDRAAFDSWASGLADATARAIARRVVLATEAYADPRTAAAEAAAWFASEPAAAQAADSLPAHIAQRWWSAKAPSQEVAAWATSLPPGRAQDAAVAEVGRLWVDQDAAAASAWLGTLPPSGGRDEAVRTMVWRVSKEAPDEAFEWARTIQQGSMRSEMLAASIGVWAARDVPAARAAVATLPPEQRGNLFEVIDGSHVRKK